MTDADQFNADRLPFPSGAGGHSRAARREVARITPARAGAALPVSGARRLRAE